jgi:hypothetical protein
MVKIRVIGLPGERFTLEVGAFCQEMAERFLNKTSCWQN